MIFDLNYRCGFAHVHGELGSTKRSPVCLIKHGNVDPG